MNPKSAFVRVALIAMTCAGATGETCAKPPVVVDSASTTVALADIPTSDAYSRAVRWMARGGLAKSPPAQRSVGLASMELDQAAISRSRIDAPADGSTRSEADLEAWSLAAGTLGVLVFIARRRLSD